MKSKKVWSDKGVSEIVGTILILAITVVLFSSIMTFVLAMPVPTNTPIADFRADLTVSTNKSGGPAYANLTILHNGGQTLFDYSTYILIKNGGSGATGGAQKIFYVHDNITKPASNIVWQIGQIWTFNLNKRFTAPNLVNSSSKLEIDVVDSQSNSMIWSSMVGSGSGTNSPVILQRWADGNITTMTVDPIVPSTYAGFSLYIRVTDSDGYTDVAGTTNGRLYTGKSTSEGVWLDVSSISGLTSPKSCDSYTSGIWRFDFPKFSDSSQYDGKPLKIYAKNNLGSAVQETYILSVQQPDVKISNTNTNTNNYYNGTPENMSMEGFPAWLKYINGDQAYVILGEDTAAPRVWGATANTSESRYAFTKGYEWIFVRVGSRTMKNVDAVNSMNVRSYVSGQIVTPPSSSHAFSLLTTSGTVYIWEAKFNSSLLPPGGYAVEINLQSSTSSGTSPAQFSATTNLAISPSQGSFFIPSLSLYDKNRRALSTAKLFGTSSSPYDLSDTSYSTVWVEVKMQTIGAPATIHDVSIADLSGKINLNGNAPTPTSTMISSVKADNTNKTYYFSINLRLANGVFWSAGTAAYSITLGYVSDADEGVYIINTPIWIKSAISTQSFVIGSNGFGVGNANFAHYDYVYQTEYDRVFTTRLLEARDESPGGGGAGSSISAYHILYFDINGDGVRDVMTAEYDTVTGFDTVGIYTNNLNTFGIWQAKTILSNYSAASGTISSMAYGDVNGDGFNDWIIATTGGVVYLYINDFPIRTFTEFAADTAFTKMQLSDINNDGMAELIGLLGGVIKVYSLAPPAAPVLIYTGMASVVDFAMGDINNDGLTDIAVTSSASGVSWLENKPTLSPRVIAISDVNISANGNTGRTTNTFSNTLNKNGIYEKLGELNGVLDLGWQLSNNLSAAWTNKVISVTAHTDNMSTEGFYFWYSVGAYPAARIFMVSVPASSSDKTFTFPLPSTSSGSIYVWVTDDNSGSDSFDDSVYVDLVQVQGISAIGFVQHVLVAGDTTYTCIGVGDMNGAYDKDIVAAKTASYKVYTIKTDGTLESSNVQAVALLLPLRETFSVSDVNGDGRADVTTICGTGTSDYSQLWTYLNLGTGTSFSPIEIKDFTAISGPVGAKAAPKGVLCIAVQYMYG